ncbi:MAG: T9SS type A sorting domain-containing protein [Bacteroidia bacterium]|nr:T9SS type A sorting domain-containing protein [Bacteroidia bacterium]
MKKLLLSITILFAGAQLNAQSFMLHDAQGANITGQTINFNSSETFNQIAYHAHVMNMASTGKTVKVRRIALGTQPFAVSDFCWTACYDPSTNLSPFGILIPAGATDTSFIAHYTHNEEETGTTTYKYSFFDQNNPNDSVFFILNFNITVGLEEHKANAIVSSAFPNPASSLFSLKYDVNEYAKTAKIVVYDMLGKAVKEMVLENKQGTAKVDVSTLNAGVYFYSFMVDDKAILSKKIVVTK